MKRLPKQTYTDKFRKEAICFVPIVQPAKNCLRQARRRIYKRISEVYGYQLDKEIRNENRLSFQTITKVAAEKLRYGLPKTTIKRMYYENRSGFGA